MLSLPLSAALTALALYLSPAAPLAPPPGDAPTCTGVMKEGGLLICETFSGEPVRVTDGGDFSVRVTSDNWGRFTVGLPRSLEDTVTLTLERTGGTTSYDIANRLDAFREVPGLDCDRVDARTQEQKDHAGRSWVKKQAAFKTFHEGDGPLNGFLRPAEGRMSSPFGPARRYTGVSKTSGETCDRTSVHRGYDIAAPVGTPIYAPAPGTIILADPDLYFEGGTVFLDHGLGLMSVMMHMSAVDVAEGDVVAAGDRLGAVGNTGRTTGPHLHWAVKWRNESSENRGGDFYIDPALLLGLNAD